MLFKEFHLFLQQSLTFKQLKRHFQQISYRDITEKLSFFLSVFLNKFAGVYEFLPERLKVLLKRNQEYQSKEMDINEYRRRGELRRKKTSLTKFYWINLIEEKPKKLLNLTKEISTSSSKN